MWPEIEQNGFAAQAGEFEVLAVEGLKLEVWATLPMSCPLAGPLARFLRAMCIPANNMAATRRR